jgi:hypothetical protein
MQLDNVKQSVMSELLIMWSLLAILVGLVFFYVLSQAHKKKNVNQYQPDPKSNTVESPRYVILNETGNILVASHHDPSQKLPDCVEKMFLEAVSSLCLITRAVASTIDPETQRPFSIYDQYALERVLAGHPLFVHMGQETKEYKIRRNRDFIEKTSNDLFGVHNSHAVNKKMSVIYNSMIVEAQDSRRRTKARTKGTRVGHLTLFCEDMMGVPVISAVLIHIDYDDSVKLTKQAKKSAWNLTTEMISFRKDTYLYHSPAFDREFGPTESLEELHKKLLKDDF